MKTNDPHEQHFEPLGPAIKPAPAERKPAPADDAWRPSVQGYERRVIDGKLQIRKIGCYDPITIKPRPS